MKNTTTVKALCRRVLSIALCGTALLASQSWAQPSNRPLLTNQSGARPNLMIALDNSGSMAFPFHETYGVVYSTDVATNLRFCPAPLAARTGTGNLVVGGQLLQPIANVTRGGAGQTCVNPATNNWVAGADQNYAPVRVARNNMSAQRSADLNPVYYNPRVTYAPRLGPDYQALTRPANLRFVSNAGSHAVNNIFYTVFRNPAGGALYTVNSQKPALPAPAWATNANRVYTLYVDTPFPVHIEYTVNGSAATPPFTFSLCRSSLLANAVSTVDRDPNAEEIGCSAVITQSVFAPGHPSSAGNTISLPADHNRTDCGSGATTCTNAQELDNVLNWYVWYSTRQLATSTAIGQSLANAEFQNRLRVGYLPINDFTLPNGPLGGNTNLAIQRNPAIATPTANPANANVLRGVRMLQGGSAANTQLYNWLNGIQSRGGTPLHNAITRVAEYYSVPGGALENAWAIDPSETASGIVDVPDSGNPEMSCRRSFNLLFSDGAWSVSAGGVAIAPNPAGADFDNMPGPAFPRVIPARPNEPFVNYLPGGIAGDDGRIAYTPFPSTGTGGLADLTAQHFWHLDKRPDVPNKVLTRPGQPTYWQNMATYTVGYMIRPSAQATGGPGLTFGRIDQYITDYQTGAAPLTPPAWPTINLLTAPNNLPLVDDFVQAGFTGGGKSFGAQSSVDVLNIFNTILADILSASGQDAGVSVSSAGSDSTTLAGALKYTVSYQTLDNSGDITGRRLATDGDETGTTAWNAEALIPSHTARNVFTMHGTNQPRLFLGRFDSFPTDIQDALRQGPDAGRIRTDESFINYLRGDNEALDTAGRLFRQRASKIAAMVNPPSMYMGGDQDYAYDLDLSGGVEGRGSYMQFADRKRGYPASLFVATNAGVMHSLHSQTGVEQSAFMPRRSLSRMLNFADEPYNFEYVLDGPISPNDIFDRRLEGGLSTSNKWQAWKQLGVGTGGRGEQLIYAVNSPFNRGSGVPANPDRGPKLNDALWETGPDIVNQADGQDVTMGYIANSARSGQTEDLSTLDDDRGRWIVAVNNGHYNGQSGGSESGLIVLDALTGDVIRTIPLPATWSAGRGLSGVTLVRSYGRTGRVTQAYAGDANGNLWRFNLMGDPGSWHVENGRPIFTVPGNRPIFGHPAWQKHSQGGFIVVFATGMMLEDSDLDDMGQQSIYGIWDRMDEHGTVVGGVPWAPVAANELQDQPMRTDDSVQVPGSLPPPNDSTWYHTSDNPINWTTQRGWRTNLGWRDAGERNIADVQNVGSSVLITTTVLRRPDNVEMCTASALPVNYMYVLNAETGSQRLSRSFDVDNDGRLDPWAVLRLAQGGYSRGVSVTRYYTRADGTPLPEDEVPNPDFDANDPTAPMSDQKRSELRAAEEHGESFRESPGGKPICRNMRGVALGTTAEGVGFGVSCPTTVWSRTQFQLSEPPKN